MFALTSAASAETMKMGGETLKYDVPAGLTKASGPGYKQFVDVVRKGLGQDVKLDSIYVPDELDRALSEQGGGKVTEYLVLSYLTVLEKHNATKADFGELKKAIAQNFGNSVPSNLKTELNKRFEDIGMGSVRIGNIKSLGTFNSTDKTISAMFLVTQQVEMDGKPTVMDMLVVSTQLLVGNRIATVNQYKVVNKPEEVSAFQKKAMDNIQQMKLRK